MTPIKPSRRSLLGGLLASLVCCFWSRIVETDKAPQLRAPNSHEDRIRPGDYKMTLRIDPTIRVATFVYDYDSNSFSDCYLSEHVTSMYHVDLRTTGT